MAESKLEQTAEEFRTLVRQAAESGRLSQPAPAAPIDTDALTATVRFAVARAMAEHAPTPTELDSALIARLEAASERLAEKAGDGDVLQHLRNVLPGQIHQEIQQQAQVTQQRIVNLEHQIAALHAESGWGRELARALLVGVVVALLLLVSVIFQKQLQDWGRDTVYPVFGIPIKEATPSPPRLAAPTAPPERR